MNADEPDLLDSFSYLLAACDQAMAEGAPVPGLPAVDVPAELRSRLEKNLGCLQRLQGLRPRKRPASPAADSQPDFLTTPSGSLGRFSIRSQLGRGGFGVVFLAHDPDLGREVALKVPRPDALVTPELRARFRREARAAAGLDHPNLVPVHEAGEAGPICYIVEGYCPGVSLAGYLKQHGDLLPARDAAGLVSLLADAVQHAHDRSVLHRDLKPANVLLQLLEADPAGTVPPAAACRLRNRCYIPRITDFGLAKFLTDDTAQNQTQTGAVVGTPAYMAPEQTGRKGQKVGPPADIHALGAMLYELLTGRPPFQAETALETLWQVQNVDAVAPTRLRPQLSRDLETVCLKCLRKEPAQRYATAADLAADLRRFLAGEPVRARPATLGERAVKWTKRRPAVAAVLASLVLLAAVAFGLVTWKWQEAEQALQDKELARKEEQEQKQRAEANLYAKVFLLARTEWLAGHLDQAKQYLAECAPEFRDERWRFLHQLCQAAVVTLRHAQPVHQLAYSPDGCRLMGVEGGGNIRFWDCQSWRELLPYAVPDFPGAVWALSYSGDGKRAVYVRWNLLTRHIPPAIHVLDLQDRKQLKVLRLSREMNLLALSPDGDRVLVGIDRTLKTLRVADGQELAVFGPLATRPGSATFSSDGAKVAVFQQNGVTSTWDAKTGSQAFEFPNPARVFHAAAFYGSDGRLAVACSPPGSQAPGGDERPLVIKVIDSRSGHELATCSGHTAQVNWLAFSPDGRRLASAGMDHTVRIWDPATGAELATLRGHTDAVHRVTFSPDARHLASASADFTVKIWDVSPFRVTKEGADPKQRAP